MSHAARADRGRRCAWVVLAALAAALASTATADPSFRGLGDLPGGSLFSVAENVSDNGSTVVGYSGSASGEAAFRWTAAGGMEPLTSGAFWSHALDVSADGSVLVGYGTSSSRDEAFRWTQAGGMVGLGHLPGGRIGSYAYGVSADGSVVVGSGWSEAIRWTQKGGMEGLGWLPGLTHGSNANAVTPDGSAIVGSSGSGSANEAFRWTREGGMVGLGDIPGGALNSQALDVTPDGLVVVGYGTWAGDVTGHDKQAFRWTEADGMVGLVGEGVMRSYAHSVSSDGSVIVGYAEWNSGWGAFIWDAANGIRNLRTVLVSDYGLEHELAGWDLSVAYGVSADGKVLVGSGTNPRGETEAWIADLNTGVIPEPLSMAFMASAFVGVVAWRARKRAKQGQRAARSR
jgi:probable HAF family extracellular repeat protein